ncbi:hypothetical protein [Aequorivita sp. KMM 9714]|uniref:hypothetical protein n=1 Tax=Aequorivita sp. KMM 9714 TaxID=2707173 RepID=UPI0013EC0316|nr:hypothetical protein [Aequorivita sp. KMM 9714]NGX84155.1 hypothetical protein [Aequorivita sp. KMM 9714]
MGIGTETPTTTLDINGALSLREGSSLNLNNSTHIDISLGSTQYSQYLITGPDNGAFSIDGISRINSAADGQIVRLINTTNRKMTIVHNSSGNASKIICPSNTNLVLGGKNTSVTLQYSKALSKWTVLSYALSLSASNNKYTVFGSTNVQKDDEGWENIQGLSITFTPTQSPIYVTYNLYGEHKGEARFRLSSATPNLPGIPYTQMRASRINDGYYHVSLPMFPVEVVVGEPITIRVQWRVDESNSGSVIENNPKSLLNPNGVTYHGRYLTIID